MSNTKNNNLSLYWLFFLAPAGVGLTALFYIVLFQFVSKYHFNDVLGIIGINQPKSFSFLIYAMSVWIGVLALYLLMRKNNITIDAIGFKGRLTLKGTLFAFGGVVIVFFLYGIVESLLKKLHIPMYWQQGATVEPKSFVDITLLFFSAVTFGAIGEDIIYRGYLLNMFRQKLPLFWAVLLSMIIFTLIHLPAFGPGITIYIFFWSIVSYGLYLYFDTIYPSILFHVINNLIAYIIMSS